MNWGRALAIGLPIVVGVGLVVAASSGDSTIVPGDGAVVWPLPDWPPSTVQEWRRGARTFGADRSSSSSGAHVHAGVDLGPPAKAGEPGRTFGARVLAPVAGVVELVGGGWDGAEAKRIEIVSPVYGRIVLGAVQKQAAVAVGQRVAAGELVGWVGRYPGGSTMLHLEQHEGARVRWKVGEPQPAGLIDPRKGVLKAYV